MSKKKQKGKNITVYVPENTARKMNGLSEVNWSQICKAAIESYVDARKSINPEARLKLEEKSRGEQADGYVFGSELAAEIVEKLNYDEVYHLRWDYLDESEEDWWYDPTSLVADWVTGTIEGERNVDDERRRKWQKKFDEWASDKGNLGWVLKLAEKKKGLRKNNAFFLGMIAALRESLAG